MNEREEYTQAVCKALDGPPPDLTQEDYLSALYELLDEVSARIEEAEGDDE